MILGGMKFTSMAIIYLELEAKFDASLRSFDLFARPSPRKVSKAQRALCLNSEFVVNSLGKKMEECHIDMKLGSCRIFFFTVSTSSTDFTVKGIQNSKKNLMMMPEQQYNILLIALSNFLKFKSFSAYHSQSFLKFYLPSRVIITEDTILGKHFLFRKTRTVENTC